MTTRRIPHVPNAYCALDLGTAMLYHSPDETERFLHKLQDWAADALQFMLEHLAFSPRRNLHVCVYRTADDAREYLGRAVSSTLAMAPFSSPTDSVVILHSEELDPRNGDAVRMRRLLTHEVVHQAIAEVTGSTKTLGDGNRGMHVSTWLNEGIAETAGLLAIDAHRRLVDAETHLVTTREYVTFGELSHVLDALDHSARATAFDYVIAAVRMLSRETGIAALFGEIPKIDATFGRDEPCSPERIGAYLCGQR